MGWGTLPEVRDRSGETLGGPGRVGGPSRRSGTGRGTLSKVWDRLGDPPRGLRRARELSRRSGTGRVTLTEVRNRLEDPPGVWDGLGDHLGGLGWVG